MILNCTKKLQEELGIKPELAQVSNELFSWHANIVRINRRKTVILTNDLTRYSVVLYGLKVKDFKNIKDLIIDAIKRNFESDCVNQEIISKYLEDIKEITFSKTQNPKSVARMNSVCRDIDICSGYFEGDDMLQIGLLKGTNSRPVSGNGYFYPKELLYKELEKLYNIPPIRCKAVKIKSKLDFEKIDVSRELIVPLNYTFRNLHNVMQKAFQWQHCHLYEFSIFNNNKEIVRILGYEDEYEFESDIKKINDEQVYLHEYLPKYKNIIYTYDFGDDWTHIIQVEDILFDYDKYHAICIDGKEDSPPENIGGEWGYYEYLEILKNESHEDYEDMKSLSESYYNEKFDIDNINRMLR